MPRYFFDLEDGQLISDEAGLELADSEAAQVHAIGLAEIVLSKRLTSGEAHPWRVIIRDDNRDLLGLVTSILV